MGCNMIRSSCESKSVPEVPTDPLPFFSCQTPDTKILAKHGQPSVSVQANSRPRSFDSAANCPVLPVVALFGLPLAISLRRKAVHTPPRKLTKAALFLMLILEVTARETVALTLPPSQITTHVAAAGQLPHFGNPTLGTTAQPTAAETGKELATTNARHAAGAELQAEKDALVKQLAETTKQLAKSIKDKERLANELAETTNQLAKSIKDKERLANELAVAARDRDLFGKQLADLSLQCRVRDNSTVHVEMENPTDLAGAVATPLPTAVPTGTHAPTDMPTTEPPMSAAPTASPMANPRKASKTSGRQLMQSSSANTRAHNPHARIACTFALL
jgi:hypothetical protein